MGMLTIAIIIAGVWAFKFYQRVFGLITVPGDGSEYVLYIPSGSGMDDLKKILAE